MTFGFWVSEPRIVVPRDWSGSTLPATLQTWTRGPRAVWGSNPMKVMLQLSVQRDSIDVTDVDVGRVKGAKYQSVPDGGDRPLKPWNLAKLFYLNTLRSTLLRRQGRNVLLLTATP